ncbi:U4/U6 small nuclear ribonucleoprotein Prp3 [Pelomyxa schiedti]|nr:U4/U6 small nuclear ribonucleoprotein Prp3 [Pelomyxa schiedti]
MGDTGKRKRDDADPPSTAPSEPVPKKRVTGEPQSTSTTGGVEAPTTASTTTTTTTTTHHARGSRDRDKERDRERDHRGKAKEKDKDKDKDKEKERSKDKKDRDREKERDRDRDRDRDRTTKREKGRDTRDTRDKDKDKERGDRKHSTGSDTTRDKREKDTRDKDRDAASGGSSGGGSSTRKRPRNGVSKFDHPLSAVPVSSSVSGPAPPGAKPAPKIDVGSLLANLAASKAALRTQLEKKQNEITEAQNRILSHQPQDVKDAIEKAKAVALQSQKRLEEQQARGGTQWHTPGQMPFLGLGGKKRFKPPPLLIDPTTGMELDELGKPVSKTALISVTTTKANKKHLLASLLESVSKESDNITKNNHYDPSMARPSAIKSQRPRRNLSFIEPGTYIKKADRVRQKAMREVLIQQGKLETADSAGMTEESAAATGGDEEEEEDPNTISLGSKALQDDVDPPIPDVEWWDLPFVKARQYPVLPTFANPSSTSTTPAKGDGWWGGDSSMELSDEAVHQIGELLQFHRLTTSIEHPPLKQPPAESRLNGPVPFMLTKRERKKLRKRVRAERLKEQHERILMGLEPPPKPKVKLTNLMRVLTNEAIQDPTEIERKVRAEVEQRKQNHEARNQARKLTKEQRKEKKKTKLVEDAKLACICAVFRVEDLRDGRNKYKVDITAQTSLLSGCLVLGTPPMFSVVIVEGGQKAINTYKKLMLRRIKWGDSAVPSTTDATATAATLGATPAPAAGCTLVWEGQVLKPEFKKFVVETVKNEQAAKRFLAMKNAEHYWEKAKNIMSANNGASTTPNPAGTESTTNVEAPPSTTEQQPPPGDSDPSLTTTTTDAPISDVEVPPPSTATDQS